MSTGTYGSAELGLEPRPVTAVIITEIELPNVQSCGSNPIQIQGFDDQKLKKKKINIWSKIAIYCQSYRRSLQPSKENIKHFKKWIR
jgi:hypothetical protein